jgi:hypothetical protein
MRVLSNQPNNSVGGGGALVRRRYRGGLCGEEIFLSSRCGEWSNKKNPF